MNLDDSDIICVCFCFGPLSVYSLEIFAIVHLYVCNLTILFTIQFTVNQFHLNCLWICFNLHDQ